MAFQLPEQDRIAKVSSVIQLVLFFALLIPIYMVCSPLVHGFFFKLLIFLADYFVVSLFLYLVIKPLAGKIEEKLRSRKS